MQSIALNNRFDGKNKIFDETLEMNSSIKIRINIIEEMHELYEYVYVYMERETESGDVCPKCV